MRILVSVASKHGATAEIGSALATALAEAGLDVDVVPPGQVEDLGAYDAVVIGSAVYLGHWISSATDFIERHEAALRERPVWLFSSGPLGDPPVPAEDPEDVAGLVVQIGARGHRVFAGEVDRSVLGLGEKVLLTAVRAQEGDFRPWPEIRAWAGEISAALAGDVRAG
jgi:menaquinone-dependent protoporphyrinogen oxidase